MAAGKFVSVDPEAWKIVDGKLYLGWSKAASNKWFENAAVNIKKGDEKWSEMTKKE
jgi:hypothetical protein